MEVPSDKNRVLAILLAFVLGTFGVHCFYLGYRLRGTLYLLLFFTGIPTLLGVVDAVSLAGEYSASKTKKRRKNKADYGFTNFVFSLIKGLIILIYKIAHFLFIGIPSMIWKILQFVFSGIGNIRKKPESRLTAKDIEDVLYGPEEKVRQDMLSKLKQQFGYKHSDIETEFPIQIGSSNRRADIVVFHPGESHTAENIYIIVECKRRDIRDDRGALLQLKSYMSASINAQYGITATYRTRVYEKTTANGRYSFKRRDTLPHRNGDFLKLSD